MQVSFYDITCVQASEKLTAPINYKLLFLYRVSGCPVPEIMWEKDGISISNNPDYMTTQDGTLCSLTIEETFTEDSARFTCRASNSAGSAETSAALKVIGEFLK